jgi:hypothetical protein
MSNVVQVTVLESMTVLAAVMVHGPEYGVSTVPAGTPVLPGPGQQPPHGSFAPGTFWPATGQVPEEVVGEGLGLVGGVVLGDGDGDGDVVGDAVGLGLGEAVGLGDELPVGDGVTPAPNRATQSVSQFRAR